MSLLLLGVGVVTGAAGVRWLIREWRAAPLTDEREQVVLTEAEWRERWEQYVRRCDELRFPHLNYRDWRTLAER